MTRHAKLAASKTKTWATCPASLALDEAEGYCDESGPAARLGTAAHGLLERCLREDVEPDSYRGRLIELIGDEERISILKKGAKWPKDPKRVVFEVDDDMTEAVTHATDYVRARCAELDVSRSNIRLETWVNPLPSRNDTGGTADIVIDAWPLVLEALDYKHGERVYVPAKHNMQTRSYGLGNLHLTSTPRDYEVVRCSIVQPRCYEAPAGGVSYEELTPAELLGWGEWLAIRANVVDDARAMIGVGATLEELFLAGLMSAGGDGSHCRYCHRKPTCPAALDAVQRAAAVDFRLSPTAPIVETPRLSEIAQWLPFIEEWCSETFAAAELHALRGNTIDGYKVVERSTQRKYDTSQTHTDIADGLAKEFGLERNGLFKPAELKSMGQVEKLVAATAQGTGKTEKAADKKKRLSEFESLFLEKPPGGLTIAPLHDKRPAVAVPRVVDEFPEVKA